MSDYSSHLVAIIGAGPAGLYAARLLANEGKHVVLLNRDIKPGGLAEYGIYYAKYKMKEGLRKQFRQILDDPQIEYFGNVTVANDRPLNIKALQDLGFQAIMVTVGAQGTKWLGIPGEQYQGVYHAKDLVYHYNSLPPFSTLNFPTAHRVALVGVGNVMLDIAHWTIRDLKVDEVIAVARRGPADVKFSKKEMENVAANLDLPEFEREMVRVAPIMEAVGQDVNEARDFILSALPKALEPVSHTRLCFTFLASPTQVLGDAHGHVCGLEVEDTTLVQSGGDTKARSLGTRRVLDVDMVVFCIGDRVDSNFGLPVKGNEFIKSPAPRFPVDGLSYEAYNPDLSEPLEGVFVAGWSREASSGLVGTARKDGENGARAMLQYLDTLAPIHDHQPALHGLMDLLQGLGQPVVNTTEVVKLAEIERAEALRLGCEDFKFKTNEEMLAALNLI